MSGKSAATRDRESNEEIQARNRASQEKINAQNLEFQRENLQWQQEQQRTQWQREDNAYQRTVSDMYAAGLNPLAMQGVNGAGEVVATSPLDAGQSYSEQGLYNRSDAVMNKISAFSQIVSNFQMLAKGMQDIQKSRAETDAIRESTLFSRDTHSSRVAQEQAREVLLNYDRADRSMRTEYNRYYGLTDDMSTSERYMHILSKTLGLSRSRSLSAPYDDAIGTYHDSDGNVSHNYYYDYTSPVFNPQSILSKIREMSVSGDKGRDGKPDYRDLDAYLDLLKMSLRGLF